MAFSLFGKKPSQSPPAPKANDDVGNSPSPDALPQRGPSAAARKSQSAPSASTSSQKIGAQAEPAADRRSLEVQEARRVVHPIAEEAAMLYANGRASECRSLLERGSTLNLGKNGEYVWLLLFDLYILLGERDAFENLALEYVVKFEKSPPSWSPIQSSAAKKGASGPSVVAFNAQLGVAAATQAEQALRFAQKSKRLRLDLSRVQQVDDEGARILLTLLQDLKGAAVEVSLVGASAFCDTLATRIETGKKEKRECWLLMLSLFQIQGKQDAFEDTAVQYAVTFEESPPSWEASAMAAIATGDQEATDEGYVIQGEIVGGGSEAYAGLQGYAANQSEVLIEMSALKRMDFVSAGMFLNVLSNLEVQGKSARLKGVNALIATLFSILGIDQFATIERRK